MTKFYFRNGHLINASTGEIEDTDPAAPVKMPMVCPDLPPYVSPVTGKVIDGRVARREDLKRTGCREIDPTEWRGEYRKEKYDRNDWKAKRDKA